MVGTISVSKRWVGVQEDVLDALSMLTTYSVVSVDDSIISMI
jgi:hypothetical protein